MISLLLWLPEISVNLSIASGPLEPETQRMIVPDSVWCGFMASAKKMLQRTLTLGSKKIGKKSLSLPAFTEQFPFHIIYRVAQKYKPDHIAFLLKNFHWFPFSSNVRFKALHKLFFSLICHYISHVFYPLVYFLFYLPFLKTKSPPIDLTYIARIAPFQQFWSSVYLSFKVKVIYVIFSIKHFSYWLNPLPCHAVSEPTLYSLNSTLRHLNFCYIQFFIFLFPQIPCSCLQRVLQIFLFPTIPCS